jgi:SAM-dependent methyltransferase
MPDSPYPELKKTHTMARKGRPWRDVKPPPSGPVWAVIQGFGSYWALVAAIELGVFDAIEGRGPSEVGPLAAQLDVSAFHLAHLLDAMVTFGFLDQVDERYELTETAERYLCTNGPASMAALVTVAPGPHANWTRLADTIRTGRVAHPVEADGVGFFGPLVQATFATQLRAATRLGPSLGWARRPRLRVLDLGAGCAPWAIGILTQSPGSTAVVNDLDDVLALAPAKIAEHGLTDRVELRPGDFYTIDIERGAYDVVVLGHILRTAGFELAQALIERAHEALAPGGEVVIADYFADDTRKRNPFAVQMGMTMLASSERGGMLTNRQVVDWLGDAGFEAVRLLEPIGFNFVYVAHKPERS